MVEWKNQRQPIIGNHYFAQASAECQLTFKNGCYFACITLCQSVAEAYGRFLYENWTGNPPAEKFKPNTHNMRNENVLPDVGDLLIDIHQQREDFHHLNKDVPTDYEELRKIATKKICQILRRDLRLSIHNTGRLKMALIKRILDLTHSQNYQQNANKTIVNTV